MKNFVALFVLFVLLSVFGCATTQQAAPNLPLVAAPAPAVCKTQVPDGCACEVNPAGDEVVSCEVPTGTSEDVSYELTLAPPPPSPKMESTGFGSKWWHWPAVGVGAALLGGGVGYAIWDQSDVNVRLQGPGK